MCSALSVSPPAEQTQHVFTYGSLMFAPVWERVCRGRYRNASAILKGYARLSVRNESYPAAIPAHSTAEITGLVYFNVSAADIELLDQFEGAEYVRRESQVSIVGAQGMENVSALFYEFIDQARVEPKPWDVDAFATEGIKSFLARHVQGFIQTGSRQS